MLHRKSRITSLLVFAVFAAMGINGQASAAVLAQYNFDLASGTATTVGTGVTAGTFTAVTSGVGLTGLSAGTNAFMRSQATGADQTAALADDDYFHVTISATNFGEVLNLTSLTFQLGATTDNTVAFSSQVYLQSSVGGLGTGNPVIAGTDTTFSIAATTALTYNANLATFDLTGAGFQGLTSITFQIRFSDNLDQNGKINRIDTVVINGAVVDAPAPIPAPAALPAGVALLALVACRRR